MPGKTRPPGPAPTWFRLAVSIALGAAIFMLIWPSFFWTAITPAAVFGAAMWVVSGKSRRTRKLCQNALTGSMIGLVGGGAGTFLFVWITGYGTVEGWEGLTAIVSGVLGAASGAVIGLAAGVAFSFNAEPE